MSKQGRDQRRSPDVLVLFPGVSRPGAWLCVLSRTWETSVLLGKVGRKERSPSGVRERHPSSEAPLSASAGTSPPPLPLPERCWAPGSKTQRQLRAPREPFPTTYLPGVLSPKSQPHSLIGPLSLSGAYLLVPSHFISGAINLKTIP